MSAPETRPQDPENLRDLAEWLETHVDTGMADHRPSMDLRRIADALEAMDGADRTFPSWRLT